MGMNGLGVLPRVGDIEQILRCKEFIVFYRIWLREFGKKGFFLFVFPVVIHVNVNWRKLRID